MLLLLPLLLVFLGAPCNAAPQVVFELENRVEGETCADTGIPGGGPGVCRSSTECPQVLELTTPVRCSNIGGNNIIVCCPQTDNVGITVGLEVDTIPNPPPVAANDPGLATDSIPNSPPVIANDTGSAPDGIQNSAIINVDNDSIDYTYDYGDGQNSINTNANYDSMSYDYDSGPSVQSSTADPRVGPGVANFNSGVDLMVDDRRAPTAL